MEEGSITVLIEDLPAARMGDVIVEVGRRMRSRWDVLTVMIGD